jgi:uncharacterized protein
LPDKSPLITCCIDSNVFISAIAFGGKPLKIMGPLLQRDFRHVTSPQLMGEVRRNLVGKLGLGREKADRFIADVLEVSSVFVPRGRVKHIRYEPDNLILEFALMGSCDVLVTGDKKHLLPLNPFHGIAVEPPSAFLARLEKP